MRSWPSVDVPRLPGKPPPLRLYDSATDEIRPTAPTDQAQMYVCGITPYDATHLGHAATYLAFDLVNRAWQDGGIPVQFVENVTDVDDPLIERAERDGEDWRDLAERETQLFREDMTALRVLPPEAFIGAVESIELVVEAVQKMLANGAAYSLEDGSGDIYFDISSDERFGYVSQYDEATMLSFFAERGGDPDREGKRHRLDPLLWKGKREGDPSWPTDIGAGRPGWHVECAAIAMDRLGPQIDLQGGGSDLRFPHHEASAAHAESVTGQWPFARHYTQAAMIGLDGEKMSKSRGNLVFVSALRQDGVDPMAIRLALLSGHYRQDREWSDSLLVEAEQRLLVWRAAASRSKALDATATLARVRECLSDDLDTPGAIAAIDWWADHADTGSDPAAAGQVVDLVDGLLGISLQPRSLLQQAET